MKKAILTVIIISLFACDVSYIKNGYNGSNKESFQYLHGQFVDHYVFTESKNLDLDALYKEFEPQITNNLSEEEMLFYLSKYVNRFRDAHSNIINSFGNSSYYPYLKGKYDEGFNNNYDQDLIDINYLYHPDNPDYQTLGSGLRDSIIVRDDKVYGYIRYASFMDSLVDLSRIITRFKTLKVEGIILDIRDNGGGAIVNAFTLTKFMAIGDGFTKKRVARVWRREGKEKYTELSSIEVGAFMHEDLELAPSSEGFNKPVALLTNRGSYSAASMAPTFFKPFDNVRQIGTKTGGGMGLPIGGMLPNGWTYRLSGNIVMPATASSYDDSDYFWEDGVPVDGGDAAEVVDDPDTDTVDEIIEAGLDFIDEYNR